MDAEGGCFQRVYGPLKVGAITFFLKFSQHYISEIKQIKGNLKKNINI